jgi:hypothetical protein
MNKKDLCIGCSKDIGMEMEFGGCYWTVDADPYCTKKCHDKHIDHIMECISTEEGFFKYMGLEDAENKRK